MSQGKAGPDSQDEMVRLVALCEDEATRRAVQQALGGQALVEWCADWAGLANGAPHAACAVAVLRRLEDEQLSALEELKRRSPDTPLVVVTSRDAEHARHLMQCGIEEVVWLGALERELPAAVARVRVHSFLIEVAVSAEGTRDLPPPVRTAISMACRTRLPVRSVNDLGRQAELSHSAFAEIWHRKWPGGPTPKRFLSWLLLLRAVALLGANRGWKAIAADLNVDVDTLSRLARRLLDRTLVEMGAGNLREIRERFGREVLDRLGILLAPDKRR